MKQSEFDEWSRRIEPILNEVGNASQRSDDEHGSDDPQSYILNDIFVALANAYQFCVRPSSALED